MKKSVLFCTGVSGSGKSTFIDKYLYDDCFYKLKSITTRPMRQNEQNGREYYFVNEQDFDTTDLATKLWVNKDFWTPGKPKWMYGVPVSEILTHPSQHLIYDVIQPKYARQMIDWFNKNNLQSKYIFKTLYFIPPTNNLKIAGQRANMPDDMSVRQKNTCDAIDFLRADLNIDFLVKSSAEETIIPSTLMNYIQTLKLNQQIKSRN